MKFNIFIFFLHLSKLYCLLNTDSLIGNYVVVSRKFCDNTLQFCEPKINSLISVKKISETEFSLKTKLFGQNDIGCPTEEFQNFFCIMRNTEVDYLSKKYKKSDCFLNGVLIIFYFKMEGKQLEIFKKDDTGCISLAEKYAKRIKGFLLIAFLIFFIFM